MKFFNDLIHINVLTEGQRDSSFVHRLVKNSNDAREFQCLNVPAGSASDAEGVDIK